MPEHQRDAWVSDYLEDVFNGHNLESLDKYMTEDIVSHWLGDRSLNGREAWAACCELPQALSPPRYWAVSLRRSPPK